MTYLALARKYRPTRFDNLVGQQHVVRALIHGLDQQKLHHAYLFTGTRGVGKTSLARILAKCFNCENGVSATPCGQCSACVDIQQGRFADLIELDAATNTSVNDVRALLDNAIYAPTRGRFKVYVIDEVHMLSNSAFNAMLKTLEEPPEHVKFILATTDPQKIPVTVLSRCLQLSLKPLAISVISDQLTYIVSEEKVEAEAAALSLLAKSAKGSMRDALSLLDQAIAHGDGKVKLEAVRQMLGIVEDDYLFRLLEILASKDADALLAQAAAMLSDGLQPDMLLGELAALLTQIAMAQMSHAAVRDLPESSEIIKAANLFNAEQLQLFYQVCIYGARDLTWAPDDETGFYMVLLRLLAFSPAEDAGALTLRSSSQKNEASIVPNNRQAQQTSSLALATETVKVLPNAAPAGTGSVLLAESPEEIKPSTAASTIHHSVNLSEKQAKWHHMIDQMQLSGPARMLAESCELVELTDDQITLRLAQAHERKKTAVSVAKLEAALQTLLGKTTFRLSFVMGQNEESTYAEIKLQQKEAECQKQIAAIESDPYAQSLLNKFDATIDHATIEPITEY